MNKNTFIQILSRNKRLPDSRDWESAIAGCRRVYLPALFADTRIGALYFKEDSVREIGSWAAESVPEEGLAPEVGGLLLGTYRENEGRYSLVIDLFAPFRKQESRSNVRLVAGRGVPEAVEAAEERFPGLLALGWFHTHPGHGPFLSATDLNQTHIFFPDPYQLAIVLDPLTDQFDTGIFSRKADGSMNNASDQSAWVSWKELSRQQQPEK